MPACACGKGDFSLVGFELAPDLRAVEVALRCHACGEVTRARYEERPERLRER